MSFKFNGLFTRFNNELQNHEIFTIFLPINWIDFTEKKNPGMQLHINLGKNIRLELERRGDDDNGGR